MTSKTKKRYTAQFGSVSTGTMRPEDLIPVFADALKDLKTSKEDRKLINDAESLDFHEDNEDGVLMDTAEYVLSELFDALDAHAPAYGYFGAHPGDGADYGWWLGEEWERNFEDVDGLKVADLTEVPKGYTGEVMQVNDHGNMTLYSYLQGRGREVWSLV